MDAIARTNWLAHRWHIDLETYDYGGWLLHVGRVSGTAFDEAGRPVSM